MHRETLVKAFIILYRPKAAPANSPLAHTVQVGHTAEDAIEAFKANNAEGNWFVEVAYETVATPAYVDPQARRWNHMFSVGFSVESYSQTADDITPAMFRTALLRRIEDLDNSPNQLEWFEATGASNDTYEVNGND